MIPPPGRPMLPRRSCTIAAARVLGILKLLVDDRRRVGVVDYVVAELAVVL